MISMRVANITFHIDIKQCLVVAALSFMVLTIAIINYI